MVTSTRLMDSVVSGIGFAITVSWDACLSGVYMLAGYAFKACCLPSQEESQVPLQHGRSTSGAFLTSQACLGAKGVDHDRIWTGSVTAIGA